MDLRKIPYELLLPLNSVSRVFGLDASSTVWQTVVSDSFVEVNNYRSSRENKINSRVSIDVREAFPSTLSADYAPPTATSTGLTDCSQASPRLNSGAPEEESIDRVSIIATVNI